MSVAPFDIHFLARIIQLQFINMNNNKHYVVDTLDFRFA